MAQGNKAKYLPCIPRLDLDNDREYTNQDIAKKIWALGFKDQVTLHTVQVALSRAGKNCGMTGRKESFPGWRWKQLARAYFDNWPEVEAGFSAIAHVEQECEPEPQKKVRKIWLDVAAILVCSIATHTFGAMEPDPDIPYSAIELERGLLVGKGNYQSACYFASRQSMRPNWAIHKP